MLLFRRSLFCLSILFWSVSAQAHLFDYLKNFETREHCSGLNGIDLVCMINLDERPEKFENSCQQLAPYGITPYRFSAINGWKLTLNEIQSVGFIYKKGMKQGIMGTCYDTSDLTPHHQKIEQSGKVYFSHCMSRGAIAIVLSHLSILKHAYDNGYQTVWVMEDDIQVVRDPRKVTHYVSLLNKFHGKNGWDVLFTDRDTKSNQGHYVKCKGFAKRPDFKYKHQGSFINRENQEGLNRIRARYGAYSMIVTRSGMKKILDFFEKHKIFLPYDMEFCFPEGIKLFSIYDDIVTTTLHAASDNGGPNYLKKKL